jgi:hypothetical protein
MLLLLILADDFTGALDTGVQFAACGIPTRVVVGEQVDLAASDAAVLVVDTETRHLPAAEAYAVIAKLTRDAMSAGVFSIYKKTDSALRGNIGAELSALLKTSGERRLPFLPAFPQIDRVTRDGVHYISGVPVTESPFGIDPFEPVRHARVTELIGEQTDVPAYSFPTLKEGEAVPEQEGILVFDASVFDNLVEHFFVDVCDQVFKTHNAALTGFERFSVFPVHRTESEKFQSCIRAHDPRLFCTAEHLCKVKFLTFIYYIDNFVRLIIFFPLYKCCKICRIIERRSV